MSEQHGGESLDLAELRRRALERISTSYKIQEPWRLTRGSVQLASGAVLLGFLLLGVAAAGLGAVPFVRVLLLLVGIALITVGTTVIGFAWGQCKVLRAWRDSLVDASAVVSGTNLPSPRPPWRAAFRKDET
jgi:hypothetical protein